MENDSESEKLGVIIFGQKFCSKLEHIPIKKRILLRDSAVYQRTPPSVEELNQTIDSLPVAQKSHLSMSPFVGNHLDLNSFSKQQADNLKSLQLNDKCRETVAMNLENADCQSLFSNIQTPIDVIVDNADKESIAAAILPCTKGELRNASSFAPVAEGESLISKSLEDVLSLKGSVTADSCSVEKSVLQPDHVSCKDLEVVQSITQDNRILWDLNVEMDAWEKPGNFLNVDSISDPTTSDPLSDSVDGERCRSVREDQQVAADSCSDKAFSIAKPSIGIESLNQSCNQELASEMDEHVTLRHGENTSKYFFCAPRRDIGSFCATPNNSAEEQNSDNKNVIIGGEASVIIIHISDNEDNDLAKKGMDSKAGQNDISLSHADQLEQKGSVKESDLLATPEEFFLAATIKAAPSTSDLTETPPKQVYIGMGNPLLCSFREGCDASSVKSVSASSVCHQSATTTVVKQVPSMDKDSWAQIEQDYEDGEFREIDMHCWNEDETETGEIACLEHEPDTEDVDDLHGSQTSESVGKGESGLKSRKGKLSETMVKEHLVRMDDVKMGLSGSRYGPRIVNNQLKKKLSGWDQLPKNGSSSSETVQETQGMLSRTLRSKLHSCSDIPTLSEDAEDKETVVERRIRPKDMDDSYPGNCGTGFDELNGKRRSTHHIHGRNRVEDRRSSLNYHDLYDNHSGSRRMNISTKGREQCRSRSPYDRSEANGPHIGYSRYSREQNGSRTEGSGRSFRGARNGYRGSFADDRSESEFCMQPQFVWRDRSFSPRPAAHSSETLTRSHSRSRTRSPPLWVPPYERLGPRVHHRSPEFSADDRVKRTRLPFWKSTYQPDSEMRYNSPPRRGYLRQNKYRWNDEEDFDLRISRDRSPLRSFGHKENFDLSCSRESFKSSEYFRPTGYRGRMRELTPDRVRGYIGSEDRRKQEDSFETGQRKRYYKGSFVRRNDAEDGISTQNYPSKGDFFENGETRSVNMRKRESKSHAKY